jgi:phage N-6-adenine-methyltransferase
MSKVNAGMMSNNSDVWGTPQNLFDKLDKEFSFTIDVCASSHNAKCANYFDEKTNGLAQKWTGSCYMNPPYSNNAAWLKKAYEEVESGNADSIVVLIPARPDTKYFHDYCMKADEIRFIKGRLKFTDEKGNERGTAPFPSMLVIFRKNRLYKNLIVSTYERE